MRSLGVVRRQSLATLLACAALVAGSCRERGADDVIPGEFLVLLDPATAEGDSAVGVSQLETLAVAARVQRTFRYSRTVRGFLAVDVSEESLRRLQREPGVRVFPNRRVRASRETQETPLDLWHLDRIDQKGGDALSTTFSYDATGAGVDVYLFDTSVRRSHHDFDVRRAQPWLDLVGGDAADPSCAEHGTHVAGLIGGATYGVAKRVTLHVGRVLDCKGNGTSAAIVAAVDSLTALQLRRPAGAPTLLANMSLGGDSIDTPLEWAINESAKAGVVYIVAAGNSDTNACNVSPAHASLATAMISVAAATQDDERASFSNWGDCVDLFAPGEKVRSAGYDSDDAVTALDGTSMAAPIVAGVAALYLQGHPTASPAQVRDALMRLAADEVADGKSPRARMIYTNF